MRHSLLFVDKTNEKVRATMRVKDIEKLRATDGVTVGVAIHDKENGNYLVTTRIEVGKIKALEEDDNIISIEESESVHPARQSPAQNGI
jgi:hypothetical protein